MTNEENLKEDDFENATKGIGLVKDIAFKAILFLILAGTLYYFLSKKFVHIIGETQGTTYTVKAYVPRMVRHDVLKKNITARLDAITKSMSTYEESSEISKFNRNTTIEPISISSDFYNVLLAAQKIYTLTEGAWDGTLYPLVRLWGFDSVPITTLPNSKWIQKEKSLIGFNKIEILSMDKIKKRTPNVMLDLNSIAPGYTVDALAELLKKAGIRDFLIELGGEVTASGQKRWRKPWRVGINSPDSSAKPTDVYKMLTLKNVSLATSGDYRNFTQINGKRYSHILDPRSGWPINNGIISVSILADTCVLADGLATGIMVLGVEKGLALLEKLDHIDGLILVRDEKGEMKEYRSAFFP